MWFLLNCCSCEVDGVLPWGYAEIKLIRGRCGSLVLRSALAFQEPLVVSLVRVVVVILIAFAAACPVYARLVPYADRKLPRIDVVPAPIVVSGR